jgi:hypothetical protein
MALLTLTLIEKNCTFVANIWHCRKYTLLALLVKHVLIKDNHMALEEVQAFGIGTKTPIKGD